ncbi:hypothetical protein ACFL59_04610 [Planctomycetota bacterium]
MLLHDREWAERRPDQAGGAVANLGGAEEEEPAAGTLAARGLWQGMRGFTLFSVDFNILCA